MKALMLSLFAVLAACQTTQSPAAPVVFSLQDMKSGETYDSTVMQVPMVLEFYFNGCPACNSNAPNVAALAEEYHGTAAQILEVSIDCDDDDYASWIRKHPSRAPVLNACDRSLTAELGVRAYPTTIVLDREHKVVYRTTGVWSSAVKTRIKGLLRQQ